MKSNVKRLQLPVPWRIEIDRCPGLADAKISNTCRARRADDSSRSRSGHGSRCSLSAKPSIPMECNSDIICWQKRTQERRSTRIGPEMTQSKLIGDPPIRLMTRSPKLVKSSRISARYLLCIWSMYISREDIVKDLAFMGTLHSPSLSPLASMRLCSCIRTFQCLSISLLI